MAAPNPPASAPLPITEVFANFGRWCVREPLQAALLIASFATLVYFYFFVEVWVSGTQTTFVWAMNAWNHSTGEQYHGRFVIFGSIALLFYHRARLAAAPKAGSNWGLAFLAFGILLFVFGARCLQPRFALLALPFLLYGAALFVWGWHVARIALFPCAFMVFMIPVAAIEQGTFYLQFLITGTISFLSKLIGISLQSVGTTLTARDGSFNFEIAEGCSGVHSLTAMSMLTAVYVHLTQDRLWKKLVIFGASLLFAIVGNIGRLFTVILVARYINAELAGGIYHDYSGFVFFPIALIAMTSFSRLVNLNWRKVLEKAMQPEPPMQVERAVNAPASASASGKPPSPISYDY